MKYIKVLPALLICILAMNVASYAQFGKNKVQYEDFDWKYIESEHFVIYYDKDLKYLADFSAIAAEKALISIENTLNYELTMKVKLIIYNSHNTFQQTNVISMFMSEGIGGVTELYKNRVVVPFQGDYAQLRHVIHHELVHAVLNDMFYGGTLQTAIATSNFQIPLWLNEGLCEYESLGGMNTETDMFMRDLTISESLPSLERLDGYLAYRGGQTFYWYVAEKYGRSKVTDFINKLKIYRNLNVAFQATFSMDIKDFSEMWERDIKKIYWPDLTKYDDPKEFASKLTDRSEIGNFYNTSPAISPDGERMAYISDREGLFGIYVQKVEPFSKDPKKKNEPKKLITSLRAKDFEDLNILTPGISWSPDGKQIAISAKAGGEDAVFIVDADDGDYEKLLFGIPSISSVAWSPDGKSIAFIGTDTIQTDIFIYNIKDKKLKEANNDIFSERHFAWAKDGRSIFFVSDRNDDTKPFQSQSDVKIWKTDYNSSDIYQLNLSDNSIKRITNDPDYEKTSLALSSDGKKLLYVSDRSGIGNIYVKDLETGAERAITNSISGITQLSLSPDDSKLLFSSQVKSGFDIYMFRLPLEKNIDKTPIPTEFRTKQIAMQEVAATSKDSEKDSTATQVNDIGTDNYGEFVVEFEEQALISPNPDVQKSLAKQADNAIKGQNIENETFVEHDYQIELSLDLVLANPGYSTYYGFQGIGQAIFSDVLGDHQIYVAANLMTDLRNSQIYLAYNYMPDLIDYSFAGFNQSAYVLRSDGYYYRFNNYGLNILASLPFDLFKRVEWGISVMGASMENVELSGMPSISRYLLVPEGRFVFDNALGGWFAPDRGARGYIEFLGSPKFGKNSVGFMTVKTDLRKYFPINDYMSLAIRGAAGASFGPDPQRFYIGGTENWINRTYFSNQLPFDGPEDYIFSNFMMPLRGWDIASMKGSKFFMTNAELRFPLFTALVAGPVPILLQGVMGSLFFDAGGAWNEGFVISKEDINGKKIPANMIMSSGIGVRTYLLGMPVKFDIAWRNEYEQWSRPVYMFSLGYDF